MSAGVFLGLTDFPSAHLPVVYPYDGNVITISQPGGGKTRGVAIPNLVLHTGSAIVSDMKDGQLTKATAFWRQQMLGQHVMVFDPFRIIPDRYFSKRPRGQDGSVFATKNTKPIVARAKFNPIDFIINSPSPHTAAYMIAEGLIPAAAVREPYWAEGGQNYSVATMKFVAFDPAMEEFAKNVGAANVDSVRNMKSVWEILSIPEFEKWALKNMLLSDDPTVADQAGMFWEADPENREIQGIRNHVRTNLTKTFGEPGILDMMTETTVDFASFSAFPQTSYFVLPGSMAQTHHRLTKMLNLIALGEIERAGLRQHGTRQPHTYFLLEEFAAMGNFTIMTDALSRIREFNCRAHLVVQNLSQLKAAYGESFQAIMGNIGCTQFFGGTNDTFTAKYLSELCGVSTRLKDGTSQGSKPGDNGTESHGTMPRPLYTPDEIMRLKLPRQIIKLNGENAVEARVINPDLSDFPEYLAFAASINRGEAPEQASNYAIRVIGKPRPTQPSVQMVARSPRQEPSAPRSNPFSGPLDWLIANILGHERE